MNKMLLAALLALATAIALPVHATPISTTIQLGTVYTGDIPDGSAPWLTATFTSDTGSTSGTLTLTSNLSDSDFLQGLNNSHSTVGWAFFLDQSLASISCSSGTCANNALFGGSYNSASVPGVFNLAFGWPSQQGRFESGDTAVYALTFASPLSDSPFAANGSGWWSVAHVQGITGPGSCSGWIVAGTGGVLASGPCSQIPIQPVPEPAELGVFGLGLLLIGLFLGVHRRWR